MSTSELLERLVRAKDDIAAAIRVKGVTPGSGLEDFPQNVLDIHQGGEPQEFIVWGNAYPTQEMSSGEELFELRDAPTGFPNNYTHIKVYFRTNIDYPNEPLNSVEFQVNPGVDLAVSGVYGNGIEGGYDCARYFDTALGSFYGFSGDSAHYYYLRFMGLTPDIAPNYSVPIKVTCLNRE